MLRVSSVIYGKMHSGNSISPLVARGVRLDIHSTMQGRQGLIDSDFSMDRYGDRPGIVLSYMDKVAR